jgi:hypothetical protein
MPAPLSLDLRKRIFAFRERTGASFEETAARNLSTTLGIELLAFSEPNLVS